MDRTYAKAINHLCNPPFINEIHDTLLHKGDEPAMVDFHIWPWFERMEIIAKYGHDPIPAAEFPKLRAWVSTMMELPAVRSTYLDSNLHEQFFTSDM